MDSRSVSGSLRTRSGTVHWTTGMCSSTYLSLLKQPCHKVSQIFLKFYLTQNKSGYLEREDVVLCYISILNARIRGISFTQK